MKKIVSILLILVMILSFAACAPKTASAKMNIAMVTDVGNIDDKSFNEFTWMGCKNWAADNGAVANYYRPSEDSDEARIETIKTAIEKGCQRHRLPRLPLRRNLSAAAAAVSGCHVPRHRPWSR